MWQRKTESEIRATRWRRRLNPAFPLFLAIVSAILGFGLSLIGWTDKFGRPHHSHSISSSAVIALYYFVTVFVVLYAINLIFGSPFGRESNPAFICGRCSSVQSASADRRCQCGGTLEPLENWKWIEDDRPNPYEGCQR